MATAATVLAHGGRFTWDEALMVLAPIAVFAALLALANKRAKAIQAEREAARETEQQTGRAQSEAQVGPPPDPTDLA